MVACQCLFTPTTCISCCLIALDMQRFDLVHSLEYKGPLLKRNLLYLLETYPQYVWYSKGRLYFMRIPLRQHFDLISFEQSLKHAGFEICSKKCSAIKVWARKKKTRKVNHKKSLYYVYSFVFPRVQWPRISSPPTIHSTMYLTLCLSCMLQHTYVHSS